MPSKSEYICRTCKIFRSVVCFFVVQDQFAYVLPSPKRMGLHDFTGYSDQNLEPGCFGGLFLLKYPLNVLFLTFPFMFWLVVSKYINLKKNTFPLIIPREYNFQLQNHCRYFHKSKSCLRDCSVLMDVCLYLLYYVFIILCVTLYPGQKLCHFSMNKSLNKLRVCLHDA